MNLRFPASLLLAFLLGIAGMASAGADDVSDFFVVVQLDNGRAVKSFLDAGVDPNVRDPRSDETPLIIALREDAMNVFEILLASPRIELELAAPNGNTALMMAAYKRNKPAVLALLAKGAAVNRPGWSPLHYAAASGADDIVRIFLDRGAAIDSRAAAMLTPLMMAVREGHESTAILLLRAGADPLLTDSEGLTAMQLAERADKPRIAAAIKSYLASRAASR